MQSRKQSNFKTDERGLVAIIVTILIMIILSLIVLGFARLTRREQNQSLDRQLSTQAFYAAETGINDAVDAINRGVVDLTQDYIGGCDDFKSAANLSTTSPRKDQLSGTDVTYSCLLVDPSPRSLEYDNIDANKSEVIPIRSTGGVNINNITIQWEDSSGGSTTSGCPPVNEFPSLWENCDTGMLRIEFVPFSGSTTRAQLLNERFIAFVQPRFGGGSGTITYASANNTGNQGVIAQANCTVSATDKDCSIQITGIPNAFTPGYLRITPIYKSAAVTICAPACGASAVELTGAQAQIDVTGKAIDVLRRMQVRVPLGSGSDFPEFAVQSYDSVCKRLAIAPPNIVSVDTPAGFSPSDCQPR